MRKLTGIVTALLLGLSLQAGAVDYTLPDLDGQSQSLDQYRGKWVVVNYWATWCGTCKKEMPDLIALHEAHKEGDIVVVGINFEDISEWRLKAFVYEQGLTYPVLRSEPVERTPLGPVPALPTTYIIDPRGKAVAGEVGLVSRQQLEDYIKNKKASAEYAEWTGYLAENL